MSLAVMGCGKKEVADDELRRIADGARGHVTALAKLHKDILPKEKQADEVLIWMKAGVDACIASREPAEKLANLYFDPPLAERLRADMLTDAASSFVQVLDYNCKESEMRAAADPMATMSKCHLACAKAWADFAGTITLLRTQAKDHGVDFPSLTGR